MESIYLTQEGRKSLIRRMKREIRLSRRLRMHIVLLAADGYSPTEIARALYCSRTTSTPSPVAFTRRERQPLLIVGGEGSVPN